MITTIQNNLQQIAHKCTHSKIVTKSGIQNCYQCGLYLPSDNVTAYKTGKLCFGTQFNPQSCLKSIKKIRQPKIVLDQQSEYFKQRHSLIEYMCSVCEKLKLTLNTTHLAIYFMDFINSKMNIPEASFKVYAATACMLGAKAIELDERIPFISKLKRYSDLTYKNTQDFSQAENDFVKALKWNLQCVTLIDVLEFYLSQGVVYSDDTVSQDFQINNQNNNLVSLDNALKEKSINSLQQNDNQKCTNESYQSKELNKSSDNQSSDRSSTTDASLTQQQSTILLSSLNESMKTLFPTKIEKEYIRLSNLIIRDHKYYNYDVNVLACASLGFLRKISGIENKWSNWLENISKLEEPVILECYNKITEQFNDYFVSSVNAIKPLMMKKGISLRHSKTNMDIQEIENNLFASKYQNNNSKNNNNNIYTLSDNKKPTPTFLKDPILEKQTSGISSNSKYSLENSGISSNQFSTNNLITYQSSLTNNNNNNGNSSYYNNQPLKQVSGISTVNSGNSNYVRHQSTVLNNQYAPQFNQRIPTYNVQKVFRVNSGNF